MTKEERDDALISMLAMTLNIEEEFATLLIQHLSNKDKELLFCEVKFKIAQNTELKKEKESLLESNATLRKDVERLSIAQAQNEVLKNAMIKDKYGIELEVAYEV